MKGIVICGPTGVGKSNIAVKIAKKIGADIISADSMQVYKQMNIGTAKITEYEQEGVEHHLIDVADPSYKFSVSDFRQKADNILNELEKNGRNVVVVGGTGLYIKSITEGLSNAPEGDFELRRELEKIESVELHKRLSEIDCESAANIHPNNRKKIIRALEVFMLSGKPISWYNNNTKKNNNYDFIKYGIEMSREMLYDRINRRVDMMLQEGLLEEARFIYENYKNCETARQAIGYKELFAYFENKISLEKAVEEIKQGSRNYAKRQFTWFKNENDIKWFNLDMVTVDNVVESIAAEFLGEKNGNNK